MAEPTSAHERNLALLEAGIDAYNQGDLGFVVEHAADDIEVVASANLANPGTFHGHDGFLTWMRDWSEAWSTNTIEVRSVEAVDDRYLLVDVHQRGEGAGSGVEVEMDLTQLIEVRDGQIARFQLHPTHEAAEAALEGLRTAAGTRPVAD